MSKDTVIPVNEAFAAQANITWPDYQRMYADSLKDPDNFWALQASEFSWIEKWNKVKDASFSEEVHIRWFSGAKLNITENCIDRHLATRARQTAILWEGDNPSESRNVTYKELHEEVSRLGNALKALGIKKGDTVSIYMPMIPEAAFAMLACARIGAIHSVVFGGFSSMALAGRIQNCASKVVITADEGVRGGKKIPLKANVDEALKQCKSVENVVVFKRTGRDVPWKSGRDVWWHDVMADAAEDCAMEVMEAEDPLFILYTSGSTGAPKGALHTTGGYMVYAALTHKLVFDYQDGDVYWCTADVGWITGHTYLVYGPLLNGATTLMFEGVPNYPDHARFWQIIDKHRVNIFYTAPTAIRALMAQGDTYIEGTSRKSLRVLGSVGEPINPEAWLWYYEKIGGKRCPVVDTWWQTETGGIMITPLPGATDLKPGSATLPFLGIEPAIVDKEGKELSGECEGSLCIKTSWPGQMRSIYGDHKRFVETYFSHVPGMYATEDGARRDKDGYYWITGREDDVIKISGHRLGTAEIESALNSHHMVAESAVVGFPHDIKGQGIYAYVTLNSGHQHSAELEKELVRHVRSTIGPIATPDHIHPVSGLPKTRSGKIMRRILRKIAENEFSTLGDTSTLTNPEIVQELIDSRKNK